MSETQQETDDALLAHMIVSTLSAQLSWSQILEIMVVKDEMARKFYAEMCRQERWSVRVLHDKINGMLFERTARSKKPKEVEKIAWA